MTNKKYLPFEEVEAWVAFECVRLDIDIVALQESCDEKNKEKIEK